MSNRPAADHAARAASKEAKVPANLSGRRSVHAFGYTIAVSLAAMWPGVASAFTAEQAATGKTDYLGQCAQCHGANLEGTEAPGLIGQDVMGNWDTAGGLYDFIAVAMPPAAPGQLGEDSYLAIVAHIMEANGAKADDTALTTADMASIKLVDVTKEGAAQMAAANQETTIEAGDTNVPQAFTWGKDLPQYTQ